MNQGHGRPGLSRHPAVSPAQEAHDHRIEISPAGGQAVLAARRALAVDLALEDLVIDELLEPCGEQMRRETQGTLELVEAPSPQKAIAQDQQGPAIAHHRKGAGDRAVEVADVLPTHAASLLQILK